MPALEEVAKEGHPFVWKLTAAALASSAGHRLGEGPGVFCVLCLGEVIVREDALSPEGLGAL